MSAAGALIADAPSLQAILAETRRLAGALAEGAADRDRDRNLPFFAFAELRSIGFGTLRVPKSFGGPGASIAETVEALAVLASGEPNVAHSLRSHFNFGETLFLAPHSAEQRRKARLILDGALFGGAHTELGTERPGDILTTLTPAGDGHRLNGHKYYATGTAYCDYLSTSALTPGGEVARVTLPVDRAGIDIRDDWDGMGQRLTASGSIVFTDVEVRAGEVHAGQRAGLSWRHASTFRQLVLMACQVGIVRAVLADALAYVGRQARPITHSHASSAREDLFVQRQVGEIAAISQAVDTLLADAAARLDRSHAAIRNGGADADAVVDASTLALASTQAVLAPLAQKAAELIFNVGGASATSRARNLDRHWRNIRTITSHNPLVYKEQAVGDWLLNGTTPPVDGGFF